MFCAQWNYFRIITLCT